MKRLALLALLLAASAASAQTARDSTHVRSAAADLDSLARDKTAPLYAKRALARLRAREDSLVRSSVVVVVPPVTPPVVTPPPDTTQPPVVVVPPVTPPPSTPPSVTDAAPASLAVLPPVPSLPYPIASRRVRVPAGANLQAAINAAACGDELTLAMGATFTGAFVLSAKPCSATAWITLRADTTDAAIGSSRMTPSRALALRLPQIITPDPQSAITFAFASHHYRLYGVEVTYGPAVTKANPGNVLVKIGDAGSNGMTIRAQVPHHIAIEHSYIHGQPLTEFKRCVLLNGSSLVIAKNWIDECHSNNNDAQAVIGYNGTDSVLVEDNTLSASHEIVMFGGDDAPSADMSPKHITLRGNWIVRPLAWFGSAPYQAGQWQQKNLIEVKDVCSYDIDGNVIENVKADAQDGFALVLKSEDQTGSAWWAQACDITVRNNHIRNVANGFNLSGHGSAPLSTNPNKTAARITIVDNLVENVGNAPFTGTGKAFQLASGIEDVLIAHNTVLTGPNSNATVLFADALSAVRLSMHSNIVHGGQNGLFLGGTTRGTVSITAAAPGYRFASNLILGPTLCSTWPASTVCPVTLPAQLPIGADGRVVGASDVKTRTAGVQVAP